MLLLDIEQQYIQPLSKADKKQLLRDIQRMLFDEEISKNREQILQEMITPGVVYDIATPTITPDDSGSRAAYRLQQFLEEHGHFGTDEFLQAVQNYI